MAESKFNISRMDFEKISKFSVSLFFLAAVECGAVSCSEDPKLAEKSYGIFEIRMWIFFDKMMKSNFIEGFERR